jgi:serine/threonine-protein kinase TTK/MPS1
MHTDVIMQGIEAGAEPQSLLTDKLTEYASFDAQHDEATVKVPTMELKQLAKSTSRLTKKRVSFTFTTDDKENMPVVVNKRAKLDDKTSKPHSCRSSNNNRDSSSSSSSSKSAYSKPSNEQSDVFHDADREITLQGERYLQLQLLGKGGSSSVHRILSCRDGAAYALKRIEIRDCDEADDVFDSYANEISLLRALKGSSPHIIELVASETNRDQRSLTLLLEAGDVDLAKLLSQRLKSTSSSSSSSSSSQLDPLFARMVWKDMLMAVQHIHLHRIVHGDLKPANFVFVKGQLKLIDFGIAKRMSADTTNIYRESQVGTINYMAPEAIAPILFVQTATATATAEEGSGAASSLSAPLVQSSSSGAERVMRLGAASDIWSLGCILYQMLYTRPPFAALSTLQKLSAIPNPAYAIAYPAHVDEEGLQAIRACLVREPKQRTAIADLLDMAYLHPYRNAVLTQSAAPAQETQETSQAVAAPELLQRMLTVLRTRAESSHPAAKQSIAQWFAGLDLAAVIEDLEAQRPASGAACRDCAVQTEAEAAVLTRSPRLNSSSLELHDGMDSISSGSTSTRTEQVSRSYLLRSRAKSLIASSAASQAKALPADMRQEIQIKPRLLPVQSHEAEERARRWTKPLPALREAAALDVGSLLKRRIGEMRKFMDLDQDATVNETVDITAFRQLN